MPEHRDITRHCTGPNENCQRAARQGRTVHLLPAYVSLSEPHLVLPTYHFATDAEAHAYLEAARLVAPTINNDAQLYAARTAQMPHYLPPGWVDPTRRRRYQ
jgi:hypothetical protein